MLMSKNNETLAILVSQTSPVEVELFSYVNAFLCHSKFAFVSENPLYTFCTYRKRKYPGRITEFMQFLHDKTKLKAWSNKKVNALSKEEVQ